MSFSKRLKITGVAVGVLTIIFSFQNCSNQSGSPGGATSPANGVNNSASTSTSTSRSGGMGSGSSAAPGGTTTTAGGATSAPSTVVTAPKVEVACTSLLHEKNSATCSTVIVGNVVKGLWYVDGSEVVDCRDQRSCTWNNVAAGIYKVKIVVFDDLEKASTSNEVTVQVVATTLSISTPATVYCNKALDAGQTATCAAIVSKEVDTGSWYVNGSKYTECENKRSCTWTNIGVNSYSVHVVVNLISGMSYQSAPFIVVAK